MGVGEFSKSVKYNSICFQYLSSRNALLELEDPVGEEHLGFEPAKTGSFIPSLAYNYAILNNKSIVVVQCAKGGSSLNKKAEEDNLGNWSIDGKLLKNSFIKIDAATVKSKTKLSAIIWSQGEADGAAIGRGRLLKNEYKQSLRNLILNYRERYGETLPFIIITTGRHTSCKVCDQGNAIVRDAQKEVAMEDEYTFIGYDETQYFIERNWMKDVVHYNQTGLNDIGEKLAHFITQNNIIK
ncbi:hypothetical protein DZ858_03520 [Marixanthomonas ophiurae]|uniref:Sialate O-acetylesterase domain-containing protein n=2 Tax=Marixanthomonas ophiurae TaxID=387659 RepID=A0A3E1QAK9_9FLAO|nr:hypothetical protein DZ858_03520 [Marixanthomonas ophiurae]